MVGVGVKNKFNRATESELLMDDNLMIVEGSNLSFAEEAALLADKEGIATIDDDIIFLHDDHDKNDSGFGATPSKKAKKADDDAMDVDESVAVTKQAKESLGKIIRNMTRKELENLVLAKTVEAIISHTEVGQLRSKVIELQIQKDKIANEMGVMMKQFVQLSTAVSSIKNGSRDPKSGIGNPVRFTRSVGLQTSIESIAKNEQHPNLNCFAGPTQNGKLANVMFRIPQQPDGVKRAHPANVKSVKKLIANQTTTIATKNVQIADPLPTPTQQNVEHSIVDLTDDDPPPPKPVPVSKTNKAARVLNKNPQQNAQPKQAAPKMISLPQKISSVPIQQQLDNSQPLVFKLTTSSGGNENGILGWRPYTPKQFILPPLPAPPHKSRNNKLKTPPKPQLTVVEESNGIVLSWEHPTVANTAEVATYQIFTCQEPFANLNKTCEWKKVGEVDSLPLPMACTISLFKEANRYYFIIRGIDVYGRAGPFCDPQSILLTVKK